MTRPKKGSTRKATSERARGRPPKDSALELGDPIAIRFEKSVLARVDGFVQDLKQSHLGTGWRVSRADAIRALVERGLSCSGHEAVTVLANESSDTK